MVPQGILEPVQHDDVTNASPVVWQRKKWSSETTRGPESSHQLQSCGRGLSNPRQGYHFP